MFSSSKAKLKPKTPFTNINSTKSSKISPLPPVSQPTTRSSSSFSVASKVITRAGRSPKASSPHIKTSTFGFPRSKPRASAPPRPPPRAVPESPLARHSRQGSAHLQKNSDDSLEVDEVELLLAPPTPTPARTLSARKNRGIDVQTPSRSRLPTRASLSYLSPPPARGTPCLLTDLTAPANRGSIMPWEQLVNDSIHILGSGELDNILGDIPAPFTPGAPSPTATNYGDSSIVGESPNLKVLNTPGGFESISQVFLPNVTPSPAILPESRLFQANEPPLADTGAVTMLRLQVASAENTAKERLTRVQELEEELRASQQARLREAEDLAAQISSLKAQLQCSEEAREKANAQVMLFPKSSEPTTRKIGKREWATMSLSCTAVLQWSSVLDQASSTLAYVKSAQETLDVLLAGLDHNERVILDGSMKSSASASVTS